MDLANLLKNGFKPELYNMKTPATGDDLDHTILEDLIIVPLVISIAIFTSAGVPVRTLTFRLSYQNLDYFKVTASNTQPASVFHEYFIGNQDNNYSDPIHSLSMPEIILHKDHRIRTAIDNLDAGDKILGASIYGLIKDGHKFNV